jgi:hypothetical protein
VARGSDEEKVEMFVCGGVRQTLVRISE